MDYKAALAALKKLDADDAEAILSAIEGHVTNLEEKSYTTIGESRKNAAKSRTLSDALTAIAKQLGIEGDVEQIASSLEEKVKEVTSNLKAAQTKASELETRASAAEDKVKNLERKDKIAGAAAKAGASAEVLAELLGDKADELAIADDGTVRVGDKGLKEFCEADEKLKLFLPALFPTTQQQEQKQQRQVQLPTGSPKSTTAQSADPIAAYASRNYGGIKAFVKTTT